MTRRIAILLPLMLLALTPATVSAQDNATGDNNSPKSIAYKHMYDGYYAGNDGRLDEGLDHCFKALEIIDSLLQTSPPDSIALLRMKSTLLMNTSCFLTGVNDFDGSFNYIQKAQEVAEQTNDYDNLVDIYYNIAISYIEQELYESAIKYFQKDIEASLKLGRTDNYEQELTIESLRIKNAIKNHDTAAVLQLIDHCNGIKGEIPKIADANGITNYCVSMISSHIEAIDFDPKLRKKYLDECEQYLHILRNTIDTSNIKLLEKMAYNPYYASFLAVSGNTGKAWQLLRDTSNFIGRDGYEMALYDYYKATKDYDNAYKLFWKQYSGRFKNHSLETAIHYEKSESRTGYERRLAALQAMAKERDREFEESKQLNQIIRTGSIWLLLIGAATIAVCLYYLRMRAKLNTQLLQSTEELLMANEELNVQHEEIIRQTDEIQTQSGIIKAQRDSLGATNNHLLESINIARDIQTTVMVSSEKLGEVVGENFIYWQPLNIVSGDFYWCAKIGGQAYLAVADCTGHGVPGALLSMYGISMLNDIVRRKPQCNAAEILDAIKAAFVKSFAFDEEQYFLDGMDVAFVIINRDLMTIDYAGAKRPLVIVRNGSLQVYKPDKISIAHNPMHKDELFTDQKIKIEKGDMVYAFSDGISDQFGYEDGVTKFGSRQLQNILTEMSFFDLPAQKKIIESSVDNWRIGAFLAGLTEIKAPQLDDHLLIGVRI